MSDTLEVEGRTEVGKRPNRRLRTTGRVPAILYGHGESPVNLAIAIDKLRPVLRHGAKVVDLNGSASGPAVIQELQWDTFGRELLHVDLLRVQAGELTRIELPIELKGEAPGAFEGGLVEQVARTVELEADVTTLPERLHLDVSTLNVGGSLTAGDIIDLPEGSKLVTPADTMLVHCVRASAESGYEAAPAEGAEPEVVGKKPDEGGEG